MIDRSYTLVTGPAGTGKTSLMEALIASNRSRWLVAIRVLEDEGIAEPDVDESGNEETRRYEAAGTVDATLLRVPRGWDGDALEVVDAVGDELLAADAVLIEGSVDVRPRQLDATVFVAPPGGPLLVEEEREVARLDGDTALSLALGLNPVPDDDEELPYGANVGDVIDEDEETFESTTLFEVPDDVSRAIERLLAEGRPIMKRKRWLRDDLDALWKADLVVIGEDDASNGAAARALREEILAVRGDEDLKYEVVGGGVHWPRSCYVADLRNRRDPGTAKVVQAVKRRWRRGA